MQADTTYKKADCTFLHVSIQHVIKQFFLDSRRQILNICKGTWERFALMSIIQ